jgi:hypothetical protein
MTPERYLRSYRPGSYTRSINNLADFLEAVAAGEDLWDGGNRHSVTYSSMNGSGDYQALKALGWSAGADYGSYGLECMYVYSPHPSSNNY